MLVVLLPWGVAMSAVEREGRLHLEENRPLEVNRLIWMLDEERRKRLP
jgi:hypothetical protein